MISLGRWNFPWNMCQEDYLRNRLIFTIVFNEMYFPTGTEGWRVSGPPPGTPKRTCHLTLPGSSSSKISEGQRKGLWKEGRRMGLWLVGVIFKNMGLQALLGYEVGWSCDWYWLVMWSTPSSKKIIIAVVYVYIFTVRETMYMSFIIFFRVDGMFKYILQMCQRILCVSNFRS